MFHAKQLVGRFVFKYISHTNNHIITISNNTKREYQNYTHLSDDKITTIYEAAELPASTLEPYTSLPFNRFIMYVGQQPDYKNIRKLGDAHQQLLGDDPGLGLVLVGRMNQDTLRNQAYFEHNGYKNIHFTGFLPDNQRDWLFTQAAAYVFPSLMEGFGLPPLEAMAYGTPVISSNASCMPEILGEAAAYFDPHSVNDIAAVIGRTINNPELLNELRQKGLSQVQNYSWRTMAEQTHTLYMDILNKS